MLASRTMTRDDLASASPSSASLDVGKRWSLNAKPTTSGEAKSPPRRGMFGAVNKLREFNYDEEQEKERQELAKFNEKTCCGRIARNKRFEYTVLLVIVFNALYIGYDVDYSAKWTKPDDLYSSEMPWGFMVMENFFAIFFTGELVIRFVGYVHKSTFIKDKAFLFDLALVIMMVAETYPLAILGSGGALKQFSILRLLRLARILRMGKLIRYFPELALIVKGMVAAVRSVGCASILLLGVLYVFSIIFTNDYHQGWLTDDEIDGEEIEYLFGSMGKSMRHLLIMGTILDDITFCMNTIRSTDQITMVFCFLIFVGLSAFTLFNMLLGILCEVVQATGQGEKSRAKDKQLRETIHKFFRTVELDNPERKKDKDGNSLFSKFEFSSMQHHKDTMKALKKLDIEKDSIEKLADVSFNVTPEDVENGRAEKGVTEKTLTSLECVASIMKLRPGKGLNCCDFNYFKKKLTDRNKEINRYLDCVEWMIGELGGFDTSDSEDEETDQAKENKGKPSQSEPLSNRRQQKRATKQVRRNMSLLAHSQAAEVIFPPPVATTTRCTTIPGHPRPMDLSPRTIRTPERDDVVAFKLEVLANKKRGKVRDMVDTLAIPEMNNTSSTWKTNNTTPHSNVTNSGKIVLPHLLRSAGDANQLNEEVPVSYSSPPFSPDQLNTGWRELDC
mmetsp:Transcript_96202/g.152178  ORF Transcript_96202/g.152178 Transcript_96202/m.152178 type:complete len:674 (+) Transcript_96202:112-2133(+)